MTYKTNFLQFSQFYEREKLVMNELSGLSKFN